MGGSEKPPFHRAAPATHCLITFHNFVWRRRRAVCIFFPHNNRTEFASFDAIKWRTLYRNGMQIGAREKPLTASDSTTFAKNAPKQPDVIGDLVLCSSCSLCTSPRSLSSFAPPLASEGLGIRLANAYYFSLEMQSLRVLIPRPSPPPRDGT